MIFAPNLRMFSVIFAASQFCFVLICRSHQDNLLKNLCQPITAAAKISCARLPFNKFHFALRCMGVPFSVWKIKAFSENNWFAFFMGIFRNQHFLGSREIFALGDKKIKSILNLTVFGFRELVVQVTKKWMANGWLMKGLRAGWGDEHFLRMVTR